MALRHNGIPKDPNELDLRIVHLNEIVPHEESDKQATQRLSDRLQRDNILRNPPIVAQEADRYILLDGATRIGALGILGVRDVLVQVVDYDTPHVSLDSWCHFIKTFSLGDLMHHIVESGIILEKVSSQEAEYALKIRRVPYYVLFRNEVAYTIPGLVDTRSRAQDLTELVNVYAGRAEVLRSTKKQLTLLIQQHTDFQAAVVFSQFKPSEIISLAISGVRLPMGITRHIVSGRVLGFNIPIDYLASSDSLHEKNARLEKWLKERITSRQVRFYQEAVFVFDD